MDVHFLQQHNFGPRLEDKVSISDQSWSAMFHPLYGYCHTLKMDLATKEAFNPNVLSQIDIFLNRKMFAIIHEESYLPDATDGDVSIILSTWKIWNLEEKTITQTNMQKLPCINDKHLTCKTKKFHNILANKYGCKASFLNTGVFMKVNASLLPECANNAVIKVTFCHFVNVKGPNRPEKRQ